MTQENTIGTEGAESTAAPSTATQAPAGEQEGKPSSEPVTQATTDEMVPRAELDKLRQQARTSDGRARAAEERAKAARDAAAQREQELQQLQLQQLPPEEREDAVMRQRISNVAAKAFPYFLASEHDLGKSHIAELVELRESGASPAQLEARATEMATQIAAEADQAKAEKTAELEAENLRLKALVEQGAAARAEQPIASGKGSRSAVTWDDIQKANVGKPVQALRAARQAGLIE